MEADFVMEFAKEMCKGFDDIEIQHPIKFRGGRGGSDAVDIFHSTRGEHIRIYCFEEHILAQTFDADENWLDEEAFNLATTSPEEVTKWAFHKFRVALTAEKLKHERELRKIDAVLKAVHPKKKWREGHVKNNKSGTVASPSERMDGHEAESPGQVAVKIDCRPAAKG